MVEPPEDVVKRAMSEHERELWDELNRKLEAAVPKGATVAEAQIAMAAAVLGEDPEIKPLFDRVAALAFHGNGFLHERLEDRDAEPSILSTLDKDDYGPIEIDIEDAFSAFVDSAGERVRILLEDSSGQGVAFVSGRLIGPEAVEQDGQKLGELAVSRDGVCAVVRIPVDPGTRCVMAPDGSVTGKLPNGAGWSVVYPDAYQAPSSRP